jgi:heme oxygenase
LEQDLKSRPSAVMQLRLQTRADREAVGTEFNRFAVDTPTGYRDFLITHARVPPLAERLIRPGDLIGNWQGRTALLADIAELHGSAPQDVGVDLPTGEAARWGALYVMERSAR